MVVQELLGCCCWGVALYLVCCDLFLAIGAGNTNNRQWKRVDPAACGASWPVLAVLRLCIVLRSYSSPKATR